MASAVPPWYLDPDTEETLCGCGHQSISHEYVSNPDDSASYPCGEDEHWVVGADGQMELQEDGCPCDDYAAG